MARRRKQDEGFELLAFQRSTERLHMLQILEISNVLRFERSKYKRSYPEELNRYYYPFRASARMNEVVERADQRAFFVHRNYKAYGVARVLFDRWVTHPEEGRISGDRVEYWLGGKLFREWEDEDVYPAVAQRVVAKALELRREREVAEATGLHGIFASVVAARARVPTGFAAHMEPFGRAVRASRLEPAEEYESLGRRRVQIYVRPDSGQST